MAHELVEQHARVDRQLGAFRGIEQSSQAHLVFTRAAHGARSPIGDLAALAGNLLTPTLLLPNVVSLISTIAFPGLGGVLPGFGRQQSNDWGLGCEIRDHKQPHWTAAGSACARPRTSTRRTASSSTGR